jgi:hypothetical protein
MLFVGIGGAPVAGRMRTMSSVPGGGFVGDLKRVDESVRETEGGTLAVDVRGVATGVGARAGVGATTCALFVGARETVGPALFVGVREMVGPPLFVGVREMVGPPLLVGVRETVGPERWVGTRDTVGPEPAVGTRETVGSEPAVGTRETVGPEPAVGTRETVGPEPGVPGVGVRPTAGLDAGVGVRCVVGIWPGGAFPDHGAPDDCGPEPACHGAPVWLDGRVGALCDGKRWAPDADVRRFVGASKSWRGGGALDGLCARGERGGAPSSSALHEASA